MTDDLTSVFGIIFVNIHGNRLFFPQNLR